jgi:hypothetical protein
LLLTAGNVNDIVGAGELLKDLQDGGEPKKRGASPRHIGRTKGGLGNKLHAVCDGLGQAGFGKN